MRLRTSLITILALTLCASTAAALVNVKSGYTLTLGELGDRYSGGLFVGLEGQIPLPGPISIVPNASYASLGKDAQFQDLLYDYITGQLPPGVPLPPELQRLGDINSSLYTAGVGVRIYVIDGFMFGLHVEPGFSYMQRELDAQGVPLRVLASYFPEFDMEVEGDKGSGFYVDFGARLLNGMPISIDLGARYIMGINLGTTSVDKFLGEKAPDYDAPESKHLSMFAFYGGIAFF